MKPQIMKSFSELPKTSTNANIKLLRHQGLSFVTPSGKPNVSMRRKYETTSVIAGSWQAFQDLTDHKINPESNNCDTRLSETLNFYA